MQVNPELQTAQAPFDANDADLVLHTKDNVAFRLSSFIMAKASPIFRDMLTVPHPPAAGALSAEYVDGKPVVRVTEGSKIMDAFLRCCYPVPSTPVSIDQLTAFYRAGDKYDVEAVRRHAVNELTGHALVPDYSFEAYVIAVHLGLQEEARRAARQTLKIPKQVILQADFRELDLVPASSLTRLLKYREACLCAVQGLCEPQYWLTSRVGRIKDRRPLWEPFYRCMECDCAIVEGRIKAMEVYCNELTDSYDGGQEVYFAVKGWCNRYLVEVARSVGEDVMPIFEALKDPDAMSRAVEVAYECEVCRPNAVKALVNLIKDIEADVDEAISEVFFENVCM